MVSWRHSVWICRHGDVTPVKMLTVGFSPGRPIKPLPGPVGFHTRLSIPLPQSPTSPFGENCIFLSLKKNMQMRECRLEASPHPVFPSHPSVGGGGLKKGDEMHLPHPSHCHIFTSSSHRDTRTESLRACWLNRPQRAFQPRGLCVTLSFFLPPLFF